MITPSMINNPNYVILDAAFTRKLSPTERNIFRKETFVLFPMNIDPNTKAIKIPA